MNSLQKWRNDRGYTREHVADMFGLKWGTIQSYELGRRTPLLSTRKLIQRVTRGAVPIWSWSWQIFVFEDAKTWPPFSEDDRFELAEGTPKDVGTTSFIFVDEGFATVWRRWGITHYRRKGNDDES